jgi:hypothetical protein
LLGIRALADHAELGSHVLDSPSELGQLAGNHRCVISVCHVCNRTDVTLDPTIDGFGGRTLLEVELEAELVRSLERGERNRQVLDR